MKPPRNTAPESSAPRRTAKFTIMLPEVVNLNLEIFAAQHHVPKSQVVEEALATHLGQKGVQIYELPQVSWKKQ